MFLLQQLCFLKITFAAKGKKCKGHVQSILSPTFAVFEHLQKLILWVFYYRNNTHGREIAKTSWY